MRLSARRPPALLPRKEHLPLIKLRSPGRPVRRLVTSFSHHSLQNNNHSKHGKFIQLMYDGSPLCTVTAYILLATRRRLVGAGKTTDWKGKFQDPASCVALCCKQLAQRVYTNLQLENLYKLTNFIPKLHALFGTAAPVT